jgi:surface polysaccharide O-acyltransferase-like enzyme
MLPLGQTDSSSVTGSHITYLRAPRPAAAPPAPPTRDRGIGLRRTRADAYRVYAILLIIWAHCEVSLGHPGNGYIAVGYLLNLIAPPAVPFFLFIAGNQLGARVAQRPDVLTVRPYVARLMRLFLIWSGIYFLHGALASERQPGLATLVRHAGRLLADPVGLLLHGTSVHLWFLVALAFSVLFCTVMLRRGRLRQLLVVAAVFYGLALVAGPYGSILDPSHDVWRREAGFLQAPLFFGLGVVLSRRQDLLPLRAGWMLIAIGLVLQTLETITFARAGQNPFGLGMLVGTVPLAAGIGVLALHPTSSWFERRVAPFAVLVPVVYLSHVMFLDLLRPQRQAFNALLFRVLLPIGVALAAFGTAWLLRRIGRRWRGVSRLATGGRLGALS